MSNSQKIGHQLLINYLPGLILIFSALFYLVTELVTTNLFNRYVFGILIVLMVQMLLNRFWLDLIVGSLILLACAYFSLALISDVFKYNEFTSKILSYFGFGFALIIVYSLSAVAMLFKRSIVKHFFADKE
ncbi:MAG TPA: hypothetical protein DEO54_09840 [Rikenellaceae bacterium]|jgi:hypothetical protein|nr:MAG: hypothetical protein A2X20_10545 [Bacteroidetes bacterium GWE2_40_15]HBZ26516.1 hypothetical protein [Rikenellaceae bacterium]